MSILYQNCNKTCGWEEVTTLQRVFGAGQHPVRTSHSTWSIGGHDNRIAMMGRSTAWKCSINMHSGMMQNATAICFQFANISFCKNVNDSFLKQVCKPFGELVCIFCL